MLWNTSDDSGAPVMTKAMKSKAQTVKAGWQLAAQQLEILAKGFPGVSGRKRTAD